MQQSEVGKRMQNTSPGRESPHLKSCRIRADLLGWPPLWTEIPPETFRVRLFKRALEEKHEAPLQNLYCLHLFKAEQRIARSSWDARPGARCQGRPSGRPVTGLHSLLPFPQLTAQGSSPQSPQPSKLANYTTARKKSSRISQQSAYREPVINLISACLPQTSFAASQHYSKPLKTASHDPA